jgi:hypothetical protein
MTTLINGPTVGRDTTGAPGRRTLVALAVTIVVAVVGLMAATGHEIAYDDKTSAIASVFDTSKGWSQVASYIGMTLVALVLFFGAALRNALKVAGRSWYADVTFLGFGALGATFASWTVTDAALWRAVDFGDESAIRTLAAISDAGFLPLMTSMIAVYVGAGLAGLTTGALPKWLSVASVVVGVIAPLGPLGFIGFLLLPLWMIAVAVCVRIEPSA